MQTFKHWEVFVKSKYENSNIKFIITGSNSSLLTQKYATMLTGRVVKLKIFSFSFREFLTFKNINYSSSLEIAKNKIAILRALDEYLKWGGYYSVISNSDTLIKKEYLKQIAEDTILKDIVPRYGIKNSMAIKDLFFYIASNATNIVNYTKLARKIGIDPKMVKEYIGYFEENFLITQIPQYHTKLSKQLSSSKKIYLNDIGFFNLSIMRTQDLGQRVENAVFLSLLQKYQEDITYLKEKNEIDFITKDAIYQVTNSIEDTEVLNRELKPLINNKFNKRKILIIKDKVKNIDFKNIEIIQLYKWLLSF